MGMRCIFPHKLELSLCCPYSLNPHYESVNVLETKNIWDQIFLLKQNAIRLKMKTIASAVSRIFLDEPVVYLV